MRRVFFLDFDGTITRVDTCVAMVTSFAGDGWKEINDLWERKEMSTEECASRTFELFQVGPAEIKKLLDRIEIDQYFPVFLDLCRQQGDRAFVLSDGYDFCIETVLSRYGIRLPYYANRLLYRDGFQIVCPYLNPDCGQCGTCKSSLMKGLKGEAEQVIYIGDGHSDTCPAEKADLVYAKGYLYQYCQEKGIPAVPFESFRDIIDHLRCEDSSSFSNV